MNLGIMTKKMTFTLTCSTPLKESLIGKAEVSVVRRGLKGYTNLHELHAAHQ